MNFVEILVALLSGSFSVCGVPDWKFCSGRLTAICLAFTKIEQHYRSSYLKKSSNWPFWITSCNSRVRSSQTGIRSTLDTGFFAIFGITVVMDNAITHILRYPSRFCDRRREGISLSDDLNQFCKKRVGIVQNVPFVSSLLVSRMLLFWVLPMNF